MTHRLSRITLLAAVIMTVAAPVSAQKPGAPVTVELITDSVASIVSGDTVWVSFLWTAEGGDVDDFQVTASKDGDVEIMYPENTGSFTSLMADATLSEGEIDFTSIRLTVPYDSRNSRFNLEVSYTFDGKTYDDFVFEGKATSSARFTVPTTTYVGEDLSVVERAEQTIPAGSGGWIEFGYSGIAPVLNDFKVTLADSAGIPVEYPQGTFTSLVHDSDLSAGETDFAGIYLDTSGIEPGTYTLSVLTTWTKGRDSGELASTLNVTVTAP